MPEQHVGICSLCGGSVIGFVGAWMATIPPPPDRCSRCGAVRSSEVIPMVRPPVAPHGTEVTSA